MRIETVSLKEVQQVWEANQQYSALSRSPELLALVNAISDMDAGSAMAIRYAEDRNPANVKLQVQKASKIVEKRVNVVVDEENQRVMFSVVD